MENQKLDPDAIAAMLGELPGWSLLSGREAIARRLEFKDFNAAFAFMTEVAGEANRLDHHPEWTNVWNRVDIVLTTHSAKGLTRLDQSLATFIQASAEKHGVKPAT
jgi:4a-hydroxytetrahydrobiopterin dehydratase